MPLRLDIRQKLTCRSERVKSVDLHPSEPWMLVSLYKGSVLVWNYETQTMVKLFELCELPVRAARFVARKHWLIAGADDMCVRVFNYNTLDRVHMFEAHSDYIRCIAVHPTHPFVLTGSDDMLIKLWDWDRKWTCSQVFDGHIHYVMQIVINPKDNNQFASASLDRTIKVWQLGSKTANFTLEGHRKGVNCVDYYSGGDKPYLISGGDDHLVKIWDYQNKTCVQTLEGHAQNVTCTIFHPELPILLTGSEDGTIRVWHSNTYRLENTLDYGLDRVWCVCGQQGSNRVALGYDEGSVLLQLGQDEPAMSMDPSGKVMWARHSEVQQAHLNTVTDTQIEDGGKLLLSVKHMGSCEIYPQTLKHSPNGRFVVLCGDGEFIIYTAMALRNKSFGSALEFVWAHDSSQYAVREGNKMVKIFKNFKEKTVLKPNGGAEGIFGGFLLGVRSNGGLAFHDWENGKLIRRIDVQPKHVRWSDSGELVCLATAESFFVLRYRPERVAAAVEEEITEDGIEDAFEVLGEVQESVKTGIWVGDCFIYTSSVNTLKYYVGGETTVVAYMDRTMYLLGYIPKDDRLYLGDKELNIVSYSLLLSVLEYETAVMRKDFSTADRVLATIPRAQRTRVAHFLERQGFRQQALAVSTDPDHKFELALQLGELKEAHQLALETQAEHKWRRLAELATTKCQFDLAQECLHHTQDYGGLLLLATSSGNRSTVGKLAEGAEEDGRTNVAFLTYFLQGKLDKCLELLIKTHRLPEAAFLARTYLPSHVSRVVQLWKEDLSKVNQKAADALADPAQYDNLFPRLQQSLLAEQYLKETSAGVRRAADFPLLTPNEGRRVLDECAGFVVKGGITGPEVTDGVVPETSLAAAAAMEDLIPPERQCADVQPVAAVLLSNTNTRPKSSGRDRDFRKSAVEELQSPGTDLQCRETTRSGPVEETRPSQETDDNTTPDVCGSEAETIIMAAEEAPAEAETTPEDSRGSQEPGSDINPVDIPGIFSGVDDVIGAVEAGGMTSEELTSEFIPGDVPVTIETETIPPPSQEPGSGIFSTVATGPEAPSEEPMSAADQPVETEATETVECDSSVQASYDMRSESIPVPVEVNTSEDSENIRTGDSSGTAPEELRSRFIPVHRHVNEESAGTTAVETPGEPGSDVISAAGAGETGATETVSEGPVKVDDAEPDGPDISSEAAVTVGTEDSQTDTNGLASKPAETARVDENLDTDFLLDVRTEEEIAPRLLPVDELISLGHTDAPSLDGFVPVQTFSGLTFDLALDPLPAQQTAAFPGNPELCPGAAPTEEASSDAVEELAGELEEEMKDEVLGEVDVDSLDLEDIDTTDIDLDEELLDI